MSNSFLAYWAQGIEADEHENLGLDAALVFSRSGSLKAGYLETLGTLPRGAPIFARSSEHLGGEVF